MIAQPRWRDAPATFLEASFAVFLAGLVVGVAAAALLLVAAAYVAAA